MIALASLLCECDTGEHGSPVCPVHEPAEYARKYPVSDTVPAPSLTTRTSEELKRAGRMLSRARGIDAMTEGEIREFLVDLALAHHRSLELIDELVKRSLPR